jgi:hypothetical protein
MISLILGHLLAFMKIAFNVAFAIVGAIPMYFAWNCIAPVYLSTYIPKMFLNIPYWHIVAIFLVCTFVGEQIQKLVPSIVSINNSSDVKTK